MNDAALVITNNYGKADQSISLPSVRDSILSQQFKLIMVPARLTTNMCRMIINPAVGAHSHGRPAVQ